MSLFRKKSKVEVLDKKYKSLLKESYKLSTVNRRASDAKAAEANEVLKEIERLESDRDT